MILTVKAHYRDPGYITRVLIAMDELGAAILALPNDLTISSYCGTWKRLRGWRRTVAHFGYGCLDAIQYQHCESAIIHDEERAEFILADLRQQGVME